MPTTFEFLGVTKRCCGDLTCYCSRSDALNDCPHLGSPLYSKLDDDEDTGEDGTVVNESPPSLLSSQLTLRKSFPASSTTPTLRMSESIVLETSLGDVQLELYWTHAPRVSPLQPLPLSVFK